MQHFAFYRQAALGLILLTGSACCLPAQAQVGNIINAAGHARKLHDQANSVRDFVNPGKIDEKPLVAFSSQKMVTLIITDVRDNNGMQIPAHLGQTPAGTENTSIGGTPASPSIATPEALKALTVAAVQAKLAQCVKIKDWNPASGDPMPKADLLMEVDVTGVSGKTTNGRIGNIPLLSALQGSVEDAEVKATLKLIDASSHIVLANVRTKWRARQQTWTTSFISQTKSGDLGDALYGAVLVAAPVLRNQMDVWVNTKLSGKSSQSGYLEVHLSGTDITIEIDPDWNTLAKGDMLEIYRVSGPIKDATDGHIKGYASKRSLGLAIVREVDGELLRCHWTEKPEEASEGNIVGDGPGNSAPEFKIVARHKTN